MELACPECGERQRLVGERTTGGIAVQCEACGARWLCNPDEPRCVVCGGGDLQTVPLAILERSRGTQLSVVGTRPIRLCSTCDAATLAAYHRNRPNPLMPDELPTGPGEVPPDRG